MAEADRHVFQILIKREERLAEFAPLLPWPQNIWVGVTIENRRFVHQPPLHVPETPQPGASSVRRGRQA